MEGHNQQDVFQECKPPPHLLEEHETTHVSKRDQGSRNVASVVNQILDTKVCLTHSGRD